MNIAAVLSDIADRYPIELRKDQHRDIPRVAWHLKMLRRHVQPGSTVADIGGGIGLMSPGMAALGYSSILLDDFSDPVNAKFPIGQLEVHKGVRIISTDATRAVNAFEPNSLDGVTSFESVEHWHNSPKPVFLALMKALKPNGVFFFGLPNCVDLVKRITVPLGIAKWSAMEDWYEQPVFRGHVREASVADLHYIAKSIGIRNYRIVGMNWHARSIRSNVVAPLARVVDVALRIRPSLCSDIYLIGHKPTSM